MDRQPVLEGERVVLRPLTEGDWEALFRVASDPLLWEQHPACDRWQPEIFRPFFDKAMQLGGALAITERGSGRIIGSSQFLLTTMDPGAIEIGATFLAREFWGGAFNREVKRLMLHHALASYPRVLFRIGQSNWRSRRAMEKIGGRLTELEELGEYRGQPMRHVVYEFTRDCLMGGPLAR